MFGSVTDDKSEICKPSNAKWQGRIGTVQKAGLFKMKQVMMHLNL